MNCHNVCFFFRAAVSLALEGVSHHELMDHVEWKSSKTALHYIKLRQMVNPAVSWTGGHANGNGTDVLIILTDFPRRFANNER